jgi:hypothetical protein
MIKKENIMGKGLFEIDYRTGTVSEGKTKLGGKLTQAHIAEVNECVKAFAAGRAQGLPYAECKGKTSDDMVRLYLDEGILTRKYTAAQLERRKKLNLA